MAYALGSLDPAICARLDKSKAVLSDKVDTIILSQVLLEMGLLTTKEMEKMVSQTLMCCKPVKKLYIQWTLNYGMNSLNCILLRQGRPKDKHPLIRLLVLITLFSR